MKSFIACAILATANAYTQSLADCNAVAAMFSNTGCSAAATGSDILSSSDVTAMTCTGADSFCVG